MSITFDNLQENLVFHANIFNYDKQYFTNLISKSIQIDFTDYAADKQKETGQVKAFLLKNSREQIQTFESLIAFIESKGSINNNNNNNFFNQQSLDQEPIRENGPGKRSITAILDLISYSFDILNSPNQSNNEINAEKKEEDSNSKLQNKIATANSNLTACLLYLDGVAMVNIDIVKVFHYYSKQLEPETTFYDLLNNILQCPNIDQNLKEISSHLLSLDLMNSEENDVKEKSIELAGWIRDHVRDTERDSPLTSNFCLLLTIESFVEYFVNELESENRYINRLFDIMLREPNINIIYESLFCLWNISNNKDFLYIFENSNDRYMEKIVQVIRTNKIDKIARIGLMTIKNLLDNESCLEQLFNIKFSRTIEILLTNKWNDPTIKELLDAINEFLKNNYKKMNSYEKYVKEIKSGILKPGSLHTTSFWEDNYKEFEADNFENIRKLVKIVESSNTSTEQKCIACFDLGEFSRLYPNGASVMDYFGAKDVLLNLIQHKNLELKNRALVCLQKIMMRSLKK